MANNIIDSPLVSKPPQTPGQNDNIRHTSLSLASAPTHLISPNAWLATPTSQRTMDLSDDEDDEKYQQKELLDDNQRDLESQHSRRDVRDQPPVAAEYLVSTRAKLVGLAGYFMLNLCLTIYNKAILGKFPYPWLITTLHTSFGAFGCSLLLARGHFKLTRLTMRSHAILVAFSFLYTVNIAMSNVSLAMVSVPFHQIARSTCPIVTILIYRAFYARSYSTATYLSLIPVIFGVALATYGDYYFTTAGIILTFVGVILASIKTVATNRLMTGELALPALEVLLRMSPLAAVQSLMYACASGEASRLLDAVSQGNISRWIWLVLAGNGFLAFLLNVSSFQTNKLAGALTISVCSNLKQCLTILLGIMLFDVKVGALNGLGMVITLAGAAVYSKVELDAKAAKQRAQALQEGQR
ncbi:MAG: UAA transporter [Bathelium mastoideum]|nr:MAG: UAA transporter [Bathelium mastoideum]KAI9686141.1 MAG: UAA transporter [Bathelium mastoideum]